MPVAEAVLIVTVIVSPLSIEGQSVESSEYTREYPQREYWDCYTQAKKILEQQHGINHTVFAVCVPASTNGEKP